MKELDTIVLATDLPEYGLQAGDIGVIVHVHNGGEAYDVEFVTLGGDTVAVVTLASEHVRAIAPQEIAHARPVGSAG